MLASRSIDSKFATLANEILYTTWCPTSGATLEGSMCDTSFQSRNGFVYIRDCRHQSAGLHDTYGTVICTFSRRAEAEA
jgi:hypothetical protein